MPTDPYVPANPADRPRQQQNLPPGIAPPPAAGWRADRPGDLGPAQPDGPLLGSPGPNVGYAYSLAKRAQDRLQLAPHEHAEDVISVLAEIAGKRAALFGRAPVIGDIDLAVALLGYDGLIDEEFAAVRARLVHDAAHHYTSRRELVDAVPASMLRMPQKNFGEHVAEWRKQAASALLPNR